MKDGDKLLVSVDLHIPARRIKDLLAAGMEGGINYWAVITGYEGDTKGVEFKHIEMPFKEGGAVLLEEDHEENSGTLRLDLESIRRGLHLLALEYPTHMTDFLNENEDACTGDVFIQCCLLGEVRYS